MHTSWILVADETRGRIFCAESRKGSINELEVLVHPEAKLSNQNLVSDASGLNRGGKHGDGQHRLDEKSDLAQHHASQFAKDIVHRLHKARCEKKFSNLVIVSAPKFLGTLRKEINNGLKQHISYELDKDLTKLNADEIRQHLPSPLPITMIQY